MLLIPCSRKDLQPSYYPGKVVLMTVFLLLPQGLKLCTSELLIHNLLVLWLQLLIVVMKYYLPVYLDCEFASSKVTWSSPVCFSCRWLWVTRCREVTAWQKESFVWRWGQRCRTCVLTHGFVFMNICLGERRWVRGSVLHGTSGAHLNC